jgi:lipopolysaccharide transport system permease protein
MIRHVLSATMIRRGEPAHEHGFGVMLLIRSIARRRALVLEMARRELTDMHAGQAAGIVWLAVHPLLLFAVYAFLFTVVFRVRVGDRGPSDYLIYLFAGLTPWLLTQDVMSRAAQVMTSNISIVKKVMFPVEVLVAKTLTSALAVQLVLLCSVLLYIVGARAAMPLTFVLLPVLFLLHLALLWGLALLLASITPYFRDVAELVRVFVTVNIYLMPIMYLPDMVPQALRFTLSMNPFSSLIWCYQDVLYFGSIAHPGAWIMLVFLAMTTLAAGSYVFVRLRHHFASVL